MLEVAQRSVAQSASVFRARAVSLEERLTSRATNPDNMIEASKLVELFTNAYGQSYFAKQVYDRDFWYTQESDESHFRENLISIVAQDNARLVGHMALHKAPGSGLVHLMLPAVHPAYRRFVFQLSRLFWQYVERLAERQQWQLLHHVTHISHPVSQVVAAKCFRSIETALLPNYILPKQISGLSSTRCRTKTTLLASVYPLNTDTLPQVTIYPPARHLAVIKELYHPLRLDRIFATSPSSTAIVSNHTSMRKPEVTPCALTGMCSLVLAPSEVADINDLVRQEDSRLSLTGKRLFVFLALDDPHCPFACQALERDGYRFCGILPLIAGRDVIILSRFDDAELEGITLYSSRAKNLREYMLHVSPQDRQRLH